MHKYVNKHLSSIEQKWMCMYDTCSLIVTRMTHVEPGATAGIDSGGSIFGMTSCLGSCFTCPAEDPVIKAWNRDTSVDDDDDAPLRKNFSIWLFMSSPDTS